MRRFYLLSVLCLLICGTSLAQVAHQNFTHKKVAGDNSFKKIMNVATPQRDGNVIWSCDFEEGSPTPTLTKSDDSETDWQIITEADYPDEMYEAGTNRCYFLPMNYTGHPGNTDPNQQISETPEHWAFVDAGSDRYPAAPTIDVSMTFSEINLSSCSMPKIQFLQSWRSLNNSSEDIYVSVSTDNGATWTDHLVNSENVAAKVYINGLMEVIIQEAANASNVAIRFRYVCTNDSWHYGWQIDDIKIIETPMNDLAIVNGRMSMFGYIDYRNVPDEYWTSMTDPAERRDYAYQIYDPYGQTPRQNWVSTTSYAAFNIEVVNNGVSAVVPKARVTVTDPSGVEIYNRTVTGHSIATSEVDTLDLATIDQESVDNTTIFYFNAADPSEIEIGRYTVTYTVFTDGADDDFAANNTVVQYFDITDNNYSKSYYQPTTSACITCYVSSAPGEDEYGTRYLYLYSPDDIMSVDVYVHRLTATGTSIKVKLYEQNDEGSNVFTRESEYYEITDEDKDSWINFTFENEYPFYFEDGESYRQITVMVTGSWDNQGENIYLGASDVLSTRSHDSYIRHGSDLDTNGDPNWYYGAEDYAITLHAGEGVAVDAAQSIAEGIEMYPNPSNGIVNFTNVENATIEVYNMMGQVVASMSNASENASIDLSGVANGNYIVRIVKDGAIATSKLNIIK
jgi:hypothetical protein